MPDSKGIDWQIEGVRLTAFVQGEVIAGKLESWLEQVSDNSPSQVNKTLSSFTGVSRSTAGFVRLNWSDNRLDLTLSSPDPKNSATIAPFAEAPSLFDRFVNRTPAIATLPAVDRVAIGLVLSADVADEAQGHELLASRIVALQLPASARDFLYRVNYPGQSGVVDGLKINRLATWSVGHMQIVEVLVKPDGSQVQQTVSESPIGIRLELDINTDQATQLALNSEFLGRILAELETIALQVASGGESVLRE